MAACVLMAVVAVALVRLHFPFPCNRKFSEAHFCGCSYVSSGLRSEVSVSMPPVISADRRRKGHHHNHEECISG